MQHLNLCNNCRSYFLWKSWFSKKWNSYSNWCINMWEI